MAEAHRIHIIGGPGSGKTYLAQELSQRLTIPHLDLDTIYWDGDFSTRTDPNQRDHRLNEIIGTEGWIVEGSYCAPWVKPSLEAADFILHMNINRTIQVTRLARRVGSRMLRGETDVSSSLMLMRWVKGFDAALDQITPPYSEKIVPIVGVSGVAEYLGGVASSQSFQKTNTI